MLARAAKVLFEELKADLDVAALWAAVEEVAPARRRDDRGGHGGLAGARERELGRGPAEVAMRAVLANRYATVRPFLALLGESKALDAVSAGKRVLAGVRGLPALARRKVGVKPLLPREVDDKLMPPAWRKAVYANPGLPQGAVDRDAYVVCVLEQLHRALNNRDIFAAPSHRWSNPCARLLDGPDRDAVEEDVLAALSLDMPVEQHLAELVRGLDAGWKQLAMRLQEAGPAAKVSIEVQDDGRRGVATGSYGVVEGLARNRVNLNKVITHWPDMLKVAGSLVTNQVRAYDLLRMFGRDGRPAPLGAAFAEYGRIAKTEHLLRVVDPVDDTYRRQMNRRLTVQESRHKLARDVCHGKRGTIHQAYRDGMEDQLGALGLVLNAIVLWTTKYIDAAVEKLRARGPRDPKQEHRPPVPAQAPQPEPAGPLQLHRLDTGRRRPAPAARPRRDGGGRGRRRERSGSDGQCLTGGGRRAAPELRVTAGSRVAGRREGGVSVRRCR
ncbi:hypothetical protein SRB17_50990 [Streptomyces sp. RB17]|nr:Tn3 family transposase [Streptomyces sp. RB17]MQY37095.1 hypothetical protein [Streptomyces sp. RB17]